eukprot:NODE_6420_length_1674_cov_2.190692.p4 GENE.NODE_6420_length_1674_cov_2.190692~~NODE_6420_length_1674_cov_2.190692.p4  ORF type:complete len:112 (-),score=22.84 NODE_6420_length_1674_cov_2.190692:105-440(-)
MHLPLMHAISAAAMPPITETGTQCLGNTAWAVAILAFENPPLLDALAAEARSRSSNWSQLNWAQLNRPCGLILRKKKKKKKKKYSAWIPASYTHLKLPTKKKIKISEKFEI